MGLLQPRLPDGDLAVWRSLPFGERLAASCRTWAMHGYGTPVAIYGVYAAKIAAYVAVWIGFCSFSGLQPHAIHTWWAEPVAFQKAMLWTMLFEGLGLGCGSGPLTGRYLPPLGGLLHFVRPGTLKLPLFPRVPIVGGDQRGLIDVMVYVGVVGLLLRALIAPAPDMSHVLPIVVAMPVLALFDKTLFLVFRSEHYWSVLVCLLFPLDALAGAKVVWIAIWWWAATSKLNQHFPAVLCVMASNSPVMRSEWLKRQLYRSYPDDLRPSRIAAAFAHFGTFVEYAFPLVLLLGGWLGEPAILMALAVMVVFHAFILTEVPMGVPLEWNVVMVYGGLVLFGAHADASLDIGSPVLVAWLVAFHVVLPLVGNLFPQWVSFLLAMRYYAGNWAYSVWLFQGDASKKLDAHLVKAAPRVQDQLSRFYDQDTVDVLMFKVVAFRAMHLHGRVLHDLVPLAVDDIEQREWVDGEIIAGLALGWNFGDGHLHNEQLLAAVQKRCRFAPGELRCILVESQPMFGRRQAWRIVDAATGLVASGSVAVADLVERQPWS